MGLWVRSSRNSMSISCRSWPFCPSSPAFRSAYAAQMTKAQSFQLDIMRPQTRFWNQTGPSSAKTVWIQLPFQQPAPPENGSQYQWYVMMPAAAKARAADMTSISAFALPRAWRMRPRESRTMPTSSSREAASCAAFSAKDCRSILPLPSLGRESSTKTRAGRMWLGSFVLQCSCTCCCCCSAASRPTTQAAMQLEPSLAVLSTTATSFTPGACMMTPSTSSGATRMPLMFSWRSRRPCTWSKRPPGVAGSSIHLPRSPDL
mmetsp:Transcript_1608/g.2428  ORF Transcript_1608/g.2428 Transcript_1608/m.2428 type:complete len:261 (+) Transcript_1608:2223-3005(+)